MQLSERTWPEMDDYFDEHSIALVPLGSTEQHGPHLPQGTDYMIAQGLAREAAERTGFLCTPTVTIGVSDHHRQFSGTMWVEPPVFREYVESVTRNLTYHGVDRVIYVNAHGGNIQHLREVGRSLRRDGTAYAIEWMWDESIPGLVDELFETNGPHAGPKETSMIAYLRDLVREDELEAAYENGMAPVDRAHFTRNGARTFHDAIENSDNGAFGDPRDASAEKGEQLFEAATDQLVELAEWLDGRPSEELLPVDHV
ncbi:creatininase family protein [Halovivax gelatinilyticus]|uniref:creatininase family protein n=1 Tax=Halovivax gelatinilyticus TaxID=2961597 RepID=UPI0020CA4DF1|nr:creatininase family protein [Halovivax gelatinilyticus]